MTYHDTLPVLFALPLLATSFVGAALTVRRLQMRREQAAFALNRPSALAVASQRRDSDAEAPSPSTISAYRAPSSPPPGAVIPDRDRSTPSDLTKSALLIPHGLHFTGMIRNAGALRVEGEILSPFVEASELVVASGGAFKGEIEVEAADIAGMMDGTIVVRGRLIVRSTAKMFGVTRCRLLHVEDGAQINGVIHMLLPKRLAASAYVGLPAAIESPPAICVEAVQPQFEY